uniref:Myb_DNA-bind_5 domain-containing protein n=1 Tax=Meloidogyne hapla TaxID=6305 RepID=A0A1I8BEV5_MELHA
MVSIMRPEQTLRLIQLYHAHYPEIARNNQDADGRNQKLQMWEKITEELNIEFDTLFTVEQYKKKVQNVQCTSRQKLFSGKRNLGEAEVEYLRLFESDKINEETLYQRAKSRVGSINNNIKCLSLPPGDFDSIIQTPSREPSVGMDSNGSLDGILKIRCELLHESKMMLKGLNATTLNEQQEKDGGTTIMVRDEINNNNNDAENNLIKTTNNQQIDSAQQFLLALLNATLDNTGNNNSNTNNNSTLEEPSIDKFVNLDNLKKKRKICLNINQKEGISPTKRSRKLDKPIRTLEENIEETKLLMEEGTTKNNLNKQELSNKNSQNILSNCQSNQPQLEEISSPNNSINLNNIQLNNLQFEQICGKIDKTNLLLNKIIELINERLPLKNNNEI